MIEKLRRSVENRIREYKQVNAIVEVEKIIKKIPQTPKGTAARYVREDRDSH